MVETVMRSVIVRMMPAIHRAYAGLIGIGAAKSTARITSSATNCLQVVFLSIWPTADQDVPGAYTPSLVTNGLRYSDR